LLPGFKGRDWGIGSGSDNAWWDRKRLSGKKN